MLQVIMVLGEDMLAKRTGLDVLAVRAVDDVIRTDDDEKDVGPHGTDALGHLHENVEAAYGFQAARDVRNDAGIGWQGREIADAAGGGTAVPEVPVNAVEDRRYLVAVLLGEGVALPLGGTVAGRAGLQVEKRHGVAGAGAEEVEIARRIVGTEIDVGLAGAVEVLEVVQDRARVEVGEEQRRAETAMADNEVGFDL